MKTAQSWCLPLLFIVSLFSSNCLFSQNDANIDSLENFFRSVSQEHISVPFKGKEYKQSEFLTLVDSFLIELYNHPKPDWKQTYFNAEYIKDKTFQKIINEIDTTHYSATYYASKIYQHLLSDIQNIAQPNQKLVAEFFLRNRIIEDTVNAEKQLKSLYLPVDYSHASLADIAKEYLYSAKFYNENEAFPYSLELYFGALDVYKELSNHAAIAETEEAIGELYSQRNLNPYFKLSIEHYQKALEEFAIAHDTLSLYIAALNLADKELYNTVDPSLKTILQESSSNRIRSNDDFKVLQDSLIEMSSLQTYELTLKTAKNALLFYAAKHNVKQDSTYWGQFLSSLFTFLGDYFSIQQDWNIAETYFLLSVQSSFVDWNRYNLNTVFYTLSHLARMFALKGDYNLSMKYCNKLLEIARKAKNSYEFGYGTYDKAKNLFILKRYDEGLSVATAGIHYEESADIHTQVKLQATAFNTMLNGYEALQSVNPIYNDSLNLYYFKYNNIISYQLDDLNKMMKIEVNAKEDVLNNRTDSLNSKVSIIINKLHNEEMQLFRAMMSRNEIQKSLIMVRDSSQQLQRLLDSQQQVISHNITSITNLNYKADSLTNVIKNRTKAVENINKTKTIITTILSSLLLLVILIGAVWFFVNKQRSFNMNLVIKQADASSRNLSHNIKADFADFLKFIYAGNFEESKDLAESAGFYLGLATSKFSDKNHTFQSEMNMLFAFADVRAKAGLTLQIVAPDNENLDWKNIKFPSDIFTTLLHNFIKNIDKTKSPMFVITVEKQQHILECEVSDNGIPSAPELYIRADRPNKGLSLLKTRIESRCKLSKYTRKLKNPFTIDPRPGIGTTIKFSLPYETIENTVS